MYLKVRKIEGCSERGVFFVLFHSIQMPSQFQNPNFFAQGEPAWGWQCQIKLKYQNPNYFLTLRKATLLPRNFTL